MMDAEQYMYATSQIKSARYRYDRLYEAVEEGIGTAPFDEDGIRELFNRDGVEEDAEEMIRGLYYQEYQDIILIDCQICVEMATKAIFPLLGVAYPTSHSIDFDDAGDLIRKIRNEDEYGEFKKKVPRAIFLTQLWSMFYTLSKYGVQDYMLATEDIFRIEDAEYALQHAEFCVELAEDLADKQKKVFEKQRGVTPFEVMLFSDKEIDEIVSED